MGGGFMLLALSAHQARLDGRGINKNDDRRAGADGLCGAVY